MFRQVYEVLSTFVLGNFYHCPVQPEIVNASFVQGEGSYTVSVTADSASPVNWLGLTLRGPTGVLYGGGQGSSFEKVGPCRYQGEFSSPLRKWMPAGAYSVEGLVVANEALRPSKEYEGELSFKFENEHVAQKPVLENAFIQKEKDGDYTLVVTAKSLAPVHWLDLVVRGPNGVIYGGGGSAHFTKVGEDTWVLHQKVSISEWDPSGDYLMEELRVANDAWLFSEVKDPLVVDVQNPQQATTPKIVSASVHPSTLPASGGTVKLTVKASSADAPINWIQVVFSAPGRCVVSGGGSRVQFEKDSEGKFVCTRDYEISPYAPAGQWVFDKLSVENAGGLASAEFEGNLTFTKESNG